MKAILALLTVTAVVLGSTAAALAIDLRNEDQREYKVQVTSSAMTQDVALNARSMSIIICVGECEFYVPGVGKVAASGSDTVAIRHGRLVHEPAAPRTAKADSKEAESGERAAKR